MEKLPEPSKSSDRSRSRLILFKVISIIFPLAVLFALEIMLRVFDYGYETSLFIPDVSDHNKLIFNPSASRKYFTDPNMATVGNREPFNRQKDKNTFRIFVLGESTTVGYPYFHNGSFHRWLSFRLSHTYPDRNFEIINLGLTAVNSFTVLGFAKEVLNYQPDAVLIYTGHNEYYGALGAGSTQAIWGGPGLVNFMLKMGDLRLVQGIRALYSKAKFSGQKQKNDGDMTRMQLMVSDQQIPFQSDIYRKGIEQFESNMNCTLEILNQNHIPVFVSNLVSNEKDMKPFESQPVSEKQYPGFQKWFSKGDKEMKSNQIGGAFLSFQAANRIYDGNAQCQYYLGKLALQLGRFDLAKKYFIRAKDLDGLRFRAPDALNSILAKLCSEYPNAYLVDTKSVFEANSSHRIIGDELMLEHIHPNLKGYALMSEVFYQSLKKQNLPDFGAGEEMSFQKLTEEMPVVPIDSLSGAFKVAKLKRSWPFNELLVSNGVNYQSFENDMAEKLARREATWDGAMNDLYNHYIQKGELLKARKIVEGLILEHPIEKDLYVKCAMLCGKLNDEQEAAYYFQKAFALAADLNIGQYLFVIYLKMDQPSKALPYLEYAIRNNPGAVNLATIKTSTEKVIQLQKTQKTDTADVTTLIEIAQIYIDMDNKDAARKYLTKILKLDSHNKQAAELLTKIGS